VIARKLCSYLQSLMWPCGQHNIRLFMHQSQAVTDLLATLVKAVKHGSHEKTGLAQTVWSCCPELTLEETVV